MTTVIQSRPVLELSISGRDFLLLAGLWLLLFLEPSHVGSLKLSHLWKIVAVAFLAYAALKRKLPPWVLFGVLYALKYLIYTQIPYGMMENLQNAAESLILPLFMGFLYNKFRTVPDYETRLVRFSVLMSFFFIYSAVPFLFGLDSLNPETDLLKYGIEENATKGLFYHIAVASQMYTFATLVLMAAYRLFKLGLVGRIVYFGTVLLGVFLIIGTFARTAWLSFIVIAFILFLRGKGLRRKVIGALMAAVLLSGTVYVYENNEAVQLRMKGGATYRQDVELSVEGLLKARIPFILVAVENLSEAGFESIVLGYGTQYGMDLFEEKTSMAIVSHNKTFEIVESSGLLGLFLYFGFVYKVFVLVRKGYYVSDPVTRDLTMVCGLLFGVFYLSSHGLPLWCEVIISGVLVANMLRARAQGSPRGA